MNKKRFPFWLRFVFFFLVFAVAFFLMIFLVDRNPGHDLRMLLAKTGTLGIISSLIYNAVERDRETAE
jgi:hypothetical protein